MNLRAAPPQPPLDEYFRVSPEEQLGRPDVQASFRNGRMVVAIDKNVILMDNDGEGSCELLNYDANM